MTERDQVAENLPDLQLAAIERFGLTTDPLEVRFVMNDGSTIPITAGRFGAHWDVGVISPNEEPRDVFRLLMATGAIRFRRATKNDAYTLIQFSGFPNKLQRAVLKGLVEGTERMYLEFSNFPEDVRVLDEHIDLPSPKSVSTFLDKVKKKISEEGNGIVGMPEFG